MGPSKTIDLTITGRVQGVSYRVAVRSLAIKASLTGYARNNSDGTVTVVAQGPDKKLEEFIRQCYHATAGADVAGIKHKAFPGAPHFEKFEIR